MSVVSFLVCFFVTLHSRSHLIIHEVALQTSSLVIHYTSHLAFVHVIFIDAIVAFQRKLVFAVE
jgi:hypothetical protein